MKSLIRELDKAFSRAILKRDRYCLMCGSAWGLECAHVISRSAMMTRWDPDNAYALCKQCHARFHGEGHGPFYDKVLGLLGEERYARLTHNGSRIARYTDDDLRDILKGLRGSSVAEHGTHNAEVAGSTPAPATK